MQTARIVQLEEGRHMERGLVLLCAGLGRQRLVGIAGRDTDTGIWWSCLVVAVLALLAPAGCSSSKAVGRGVDAGPVVSNPAIDAPATSPGGDPGTTATIPAAAAPTITPGTKPSSSPIPVTVTCSSAGTIPYLTTDGSTPTTASTQSGSTTFKTSGTIEAICAGGGYSASPAASATYAIVSGGTITHGLAIPVDHPRIWFTPERLAMARSWWKTHSFTPIAAGGYYFFEAAFAHLASNGALSCRTVYPDDKTSAIAFALTNPATAGQDEARWYGDLVIAIYDWCYDELTDKEKTQLQSDINSWITANMNASWGDPSMFLDNYFWGFMRNEIDWGIASYYENTAKAETFLDDALNVRWTNSFVPSVKTTSAGGVFQEGNQYGRYIAYYSTMPFTTARLDGRDLYGESTFFKSAVLALIYGTTPALTTSTLLGTTGYEVFPFGDDQFWRDGNSALSRMWGDSPGSELGDWMQLMALEWPSTNISRYAQQWVNMVGIGPHVDYYLQPFQGGTTPLAFSNLPLDYYASGIKFFYARKAWDTSSAVLHLQLGAPAPPAALAHQHADCGNWQMWRGGRWLSRESNSYSENVAGYGGSGSVDGMNGPAHNVVLINPDSQGCSADKTCVAGGGGATYEDYNTMPSVTRLETQPGYAYAVSDLSGTYRNNVVDPKNTQQDNPGAKTVIREFVFMRDLETLVIFDRLEANAVGAVPAASIKKTFLAHCEVPWTMDDGQHSTCTNGPQALRLTTLVPAASTRKSITEGDPGVGQYRLEVTDAGSAQSYFLHVLQARAAAGANLSPSVTDNGSSYTVTLDGTHSLVFKKGMNSNGGSMTISGNTTNFRTDVQSISYDDSGPVW